MKTLNERLFDTIDTIENLQIELNQTLLLKEDNRKYTLFRLHETKKLLEHMKKDVMRVKN